MKCSSATGPPASSNYFMKLTCGGCPSHRTRLYPSALNCNRSHLTQVSTSRLVSYRLLYSFRETENPFWRKWPSLGDERIWPTLGEEENWPSLGEEANWPSLSKEGNWPSLSKEEVEITKKKIHRLAYRFSMDFKIYRLAYGFLCVNHKVYRFLVRAFFSQDLKNP